MGIGKNPPKEMIPLEKLGFKQKSSVRVIRKNFRLIHYRFTEDTQDNSTSSALYDNPLKNDSKKACANNRVVVPSTIFRM